MGVIVIVAYKPKPGKQDALKKLMAIHYPVLEKEGLVTERTPILMVAEDGTNVEVFEWLNEEAIQQAHTNPEVLKLWAAYFEVCDVVPLVTLPESKTMFASFAPLSF